MNTHRNRLLRSIVDFLPGALILAMSLLTGCDKSDHTAGNIDLPDTNTQYTLLPPAISIEPFGGTTPATRAAVAIKEERQAFNIGEELGNIITLDNSKPEEIPQTRALANGTFYRIVVYSLTEWNNGTLNILEQRLCKTGQTGYFADAGDKTDPIYLYPGDYRIFVYSFNKTAYDTKLAKLADGTVNVPLASGDDFLSSDIISKNITAAQLGTDVALGSITLKHRCCRLTGTLTAEAFTATGILISPAPSLSVGGVSTAGNWSIKNSNVSTTTTGTQAITLAKSGNNYTGTVMLLPMSTKAVTATYNFKPNGATKNVTATNKSINSNATFSSGGSYSFTIKAIGAYVLTVPDNPATTGIQIGSYKYAYSNLDSKTKKLETYPWVSGKQNGSDNDYWRWNVKDVDTSSANGPSKWNSSTDPCRAYLGTSWKVPPSSYLSNLVGYKLNSKRVYINGISATTDGAGWVSSGTVKGCVFVDTSRGTCIFLPAAGYRKGGDYSAAGSNGNYWTATLYTNYTSYAYNLNFSSGSCNVNTGSYRRNYSYSIRCSQ